MIIYSRVLVNIHFEFLLYTHVAMPLKTCYFTKFMYINVLSILLLSNEYEGRVFTIHLWKSLFLPLFLRRKCREREVFWSWPNTCGQGLVPLIKKHSGEYYSVDQKKIFKWHGAWEYTLINMCKRTWKFRMWIARFYIWYIKTKNIH